jgi:hypothetical protein
MNYTFYNNSGFDGSAVDTYAVPMDPSALAMPNNVGGCDPFAAVACASHEDLLQSGNLAYRTTLSDLERVSREHNELLVQHNTLQCVDCSSHADQDSHGSRSCWQEVLQRLNMGSSPSLSRSSSVSPAGPRLSPAPKQDGTSCVYWTRAEYTKVQGRKAVTLEYLEDAEGNMLPSTWRTALSRRARTKWEEYVRKGTAPLTWGTIAADVWDDFVVYMYDALPELRLCANDWKLWQWCTTHYPDWYKKHGASGTGTKREADDDGQSSSPKRVKTGKFVLRTVPSVND